MKLPVKFSFKKQYLVTYVVPAAVLLLLGAMLIFAPIHAGGEMPPPEAQLTTAPTAAPTEAPTTAAPTDGPTEAPTEAPTEEPFTPVEAVVRAESLYIRASAGVSGKQVGSYKENTIITILEEKIVNGTKWGRTNKGWVCMNYVEVGGAPRPTEPKPTEPQPTQPKPTEPPVVYEELEPNPFTKDDFTKKNHIITCKTERTAIGVDISRWQEDVDFEKLKAAGVDYVMIRAGYRGTSWSGRLVKDLYVDQNYAGAKAAGLKVGFYFFSQARTVAEAKEEAEFLLDIVKDWDVDLPLVCDWEYFNKSDTPRVYGLSRRRVTDCIKAFCETVQDAGYYAMVYTANYMVKNNIYLEELGEYGLWYADYRNYLSSTFRVDMWQYTASGKISGITGNVDMNVLFLENSIFAEIFAEEE